MGGILTFAEIISYVKLSKLFRNLASLTNLQTVFDLLSDTINVQDEATVL